MSKPIRVLHVFHGMDCGGAENMIMNLYRNIDRSKVQFDFLVHTKKKCFFDDEIKNLGGRIFFVPYYNIKNTVAYKKALRHLYESHPEIKIVHGHLGSCAHIYLNIAKEHGCYTIAHSHNTLPTDRSIKNVLYRLFTLRTRKVADYFFACGKQAGLDRFGEKIVSSDRFQVLNNAIDTQKYIYNPEIRQKMRAELGLEEAFVVGHIGRFNYQKNHEFLIDIFDAVLKKEPKARLLLVGDGNLRPEIENKISRLGIKDKVIMTGIRKDVPDLLQAMDCFVFPSHYEGLGIVAVEAQAAGVPTLCSDAVPDEVDLTDLVKRIPLSAPVEEWCNAILEYNNGYERRDTQQEVIDGRYDIHQTANWLERFYIKVCEKCLHV